MTKRIESLTPEQQAWLPAQAEKWIGIGLSTEPANREAAEAGVRVAYAAAKLDPPRLIIWLDSPLAGAWGRVLAPTALGGSQVGAQVGDQVGDQVWDQVRDQVWAQVGDQVWDQVWAQVRAQVSDQVGDQVGAQVRDQVWAQVGDQVGDQVWDQVRDQVWAQVGDQVWDQVWAQVRAQVSDQVGDQVWDQVWAQVWAQVRAQVSDQVRAQVSDQVGDQVRDQVGDQVREQVWDQVRDQVRDWHRGLIDPWAIYWSSWIDTAERLGATGLEPFRGIRTVAENAGWWWCFRDFAVITERPNLIRLDNQGRLHSADGPAIAYPDRFAVHAWHGTRVPADLVAGDWTIEQALREPNAEVRRCAVEILAERGGWSQIIATAGWSQVGSAVPDPGNAGQELTLWHVPAEGSRSGGVGLYEQPVRLLRCTNATRERDGSRHEFGLTVPESIADPVAAAAWTFGLDASTYGGLVRAC